MTPDRGGAAMTRAALLTALLLLAGAHAAAGQSLLSTRGLGVPIAPVEARARALGGASIGLLGVSPSLGNPAGVAGTGFRGVAVAMQPTMRDVEFAGRAGSIDATRFPLVRILYPASGRMTATLAYGSFLDQTWAVETEGTAVIGSDTVPTTDLVESTGGLAQLHLGAAYTVSSALALGASIGIYTGDLQREITRTFPDTLTSPLRSFQTRVSWNYRAPLASLGIRWDPLPLLRIGASFTWVGRLEAEGDDGDPPDRAYDLPLQFGAGASAWLAPRVLAAVSAQWAGWSRAADDFQPPAQAGEAGTVARDVWNLGGGLEWSGPRAGERSFPIRLGFHYAQLPFRLDSEADASEWAAALGLGLRLAGTEETPLAVVDLALERGRRHGASSDATPDGLTEDFWRLTLSLNLFGR